MNINLKCPNCGTVAAVVASDGMEKLKLACPHCKQTRPVGEYWPKLSLRTGAEKYQLHFGPQWVGRKSEGNNAEVQMPDPSRYMSRRHVLLQICCTAQGLRVTMEEHGKNPTELQGVELMEGDIVYLNVNDCLKMGDRRMYLANEYE